jgi:two-component system, cell cycle sensor histidine kinase and response regulator CckA
MTGRIRILICEDSDDDAVLVAAHLKRGGLKVEYERAETADAMAEMLRRRPPDMVISDYSMPGFGAEDALRVLHDSGLDVPFILVSGRIGEESAVTLMRAGAHDFILKNRMARLVPVVRRELHQAQARRERQVAEAALRTSEQRLRQAERLESLGRLAGGIAHDFNNLLAVILGHTDLILAELPEDSPYRENLDLVRQLAERSAALTRQLLVFSREEPLRPETLDVNEVVADTERVLRGAIGENVVFVTRLAPDLCPVRIDRCELERVLLNLVTNSRRAMPRGGRLTVETCNIQGDGDGDGSGDGIGDGGVGDGNNSGNDGALVRLSVTDTGTGMSESVAKHAFEPFFTTDTVVGTGLGLSTAYGVVMAAGGEISLTSEPGVGTSVRIDLPAVDHTAAATPNPEPPPARGHGETVLVVEDEDDVRDLVALMLRRSGYRVVEARSPAEAALIVEAAGLPIDALLTDLVMAGMSGIELAERVRGRLPGLPVLLMSGYTAGTLPGGAELPRGISLIRKPFTTAALLRSLGEVLGDQTARRGLPG